MKKTKQLTFRASEEEQAIVNALSFFWKRSKADAVRYSIRQAALTEGIVQEEKNPYLDKPENGRLEAA